MYQEQAFIIDQILHNESYSFDLLVDHLHNNPHEISILKKAINEDAKEIPHDLITNYIIKQSIENRKELFDEICKIYRKPFLTHRTSLSRVLIINQEVFLHIIKNDVRFFRDGPERTSVNVIEDSLNSTLGTFFPQYFSKENTVRKKELYDALKNLEDESNPPLITTTKLKPGTGVGKRRRKRYCLTNEGFDEIIPIVLIAIRDELENLSNQIY
jgi:hypothetical protein